MLFVKSRFVSKGIPLTLSSYDSSGSRTQISRTGCYFMNEQRAYVSHEFGGERNMMASCVLIRAESDEKEEI